MRLALGATARDVERFLPHTLLIVDEIRNHSLRLWPGDVFSVVFFENDSRDGTREYLQAWARSRPGAEVISHPGLDRTHPKRTQRLAFGRNEILRRFRALHSSTPIDRVLVMDMDDVCEQLDVGAVFRYILSDFTGVAVKCANSSPRHTDLWALRGLGPIDPHCMTSDKGLPKWAVCSRRLIDLGVHDPNVLTDTLESFRAGVPAVEVESCFNHMAIYNGPALLDETLCQYHGMIGAHEECEHVPLNSCLRRQGYRVQVEPDWLVVGHHKKRNYVQPELASPISSRAIPRLSCIFAWGDSYVARDTEEQADPGYFQREWRPNAAWVWVRAGNTGADIALFAREVIPILTQPIVLLTGDGDATIPEDLPPDAAKLILDSPHVACWLAQNCSAPYSYGGKIRPLPIGLDDKEPNDGLLGPPTPRPMTGSVYIDCHFTQQRVHGSGRGRRETFSLIKDLPHVQHPPRRLPRDLLHKQWRGVDFVVCLEGNGLDTHQAWEVLCMNRIPIVQKSPMAESLFRGLPVLLCEDVVAGVKDQAALLRTARDMAQASVFDLRCGLWLGRAAGEGARPLWRSERGARSGGPGRGGSLMNGWWLWCWLGLVLCITVSLVGVALFLSCRPRG